MMGPRAATRATRAWCSVGLQVDGALCQSFGNPRLVRGLCASCGAAAAHGPLLLRSGAGLTGRAALLASCCRRDRLGARQLHGALRRPAHHAGGKPILGSGQGGCAGQGLGRKRGVRAIPLAAARNMVLSLPPAYCFRLRLHQALDATAAYLALPALPACRLSAPTAAPCGPCSSECPPPLQTLGRAMPHGSRQSGGQLEQPLLLAPACPACASLGGGGPTQRVLCGA